MTNTKNRNEIMYKKQPDKRGQEETVLPQNMVKKDKQTNKKQEWL